MGSAVWTGTQVRGAVLASWGGGSLQWVVGDSADGVAGTWRLVGGGEVKGAALSTAKVGLDGVKGAFEALGNPERHTKILVEPWR